MKFAVIIPSFNRKELLARLLSQLFVQLETDDIVVVVNDGSTDGTSEMLNKEFPQVIEVLGDGNWWYTRSINEGLKKSLKLSVDHFLLLNDDIEIDEKYIQSQKNSISYIDKPCIMGSLSITYEKPQKITFSGVKEFKWWRYKSIDYDPFLSEFNRDLSGIRESKVLPGRGMLINKKIIIKIGLFDERLTQYGSDDEICLRAHKFGFPVYINLDAIILSHHRLTGSGSTFVKESFVNHLKSYTNKYSRNYWKKYLILTWNYGIIFLLPFTWVIIFLGNLKSFLSYKEKS